MDEFIADFDPLGALEADYAAVVARTRVPRDDPANDDADDAEDATDEKRAPEPTGESDADEHDDGDLFDGAELYVPLAADSDEEYDDYGADEEEEEQQAPPVLAVVVPPPQPMDETTKHAIMAAMRPLQLQAPSWARDAAIADDELVELVQRRLQRSAAPPPQQDQDQT